MKATAPIEEHDVIKAVRDFFSCILVSVWRLVAFDFVGVVADKMLDLGFIFGFYHNICILHPIFIFNRVRKCKHSFYGCNHTVTTFHRSSHIS